MGLVNSPDVTPKKAAANGQNAQHSTGPHTEAGKQNSSLNGLVHGVYSQTHTYAAIVALGESPLAFERHRARLQGSWGFGLDPLFDAEIDQLAWLLWRKQRVEGARDAILVARKEQADTEGRCREREHLRDTVDVEEASRIGLRRIQDSPAADPGGIGGAPGGRPAARLRARPRHPHRVSLRGRDHRPGANDPRYIPQIVPPGGGDEGEKPGETA
jgi:hypothetical protein